MTGGSPETPRILLLGKNGQVGWELRRTLLPLGRVTALGSEDVDLADPGATRAAVRETKPDLIVAAAAYTAVDAAEEEPELAMAVNGTAPGVLAEEAERSGAAIVHYSTDYVFDGGKSEPYTEEDEPSPINVYGETKLAGERAVRDSGAPYLLLRTSWVYGLRGKNFLLSILRLAREREELRIVNDQVGAPTWCRAIAETTAQTLAQSRGDFAGFLRENGGLYHLSAAGQTSWHGFASEILTHQEASSLAPTELTPIPTSEYPTPAARPLNSLLSSSRLERTSGLTMPPWEKQLELCLGEGDA